MTENNGYLPFPKGFATAVIHAGQDPEEWESLCVVPPIVLSSTFKQFSSDSKKLVKYEYTRIANPTRDVLETCLATVEGGKYGLCFSSGTAAITTLFNLFEAGDEILCGEDIYFGTSELLNKILRKLGVNVKYINVSNIDDLEAAINPKTKVVFIESPSNPLLRIVDIKAIAEVTKRRNTLLAIDNSFLTPYLQKPFELGVDICVYSLSKYMNGHCDVVMGAIIVNNDEVHAQLRYSQETMGTVPSPFDCYQALRGLKTLPIRMKLHSSNGLAVAQYLERHPKVEKVIHPGLPSHPQHELFKRQTSGHCGIITMYIKGGLKEAELFVKKVKIFVNAASFGGYESIIEIPRNSSARCMEAELRLSLNITDNMIRISVGLEDIDDLLDDLEQAFNYI